MLHSTYSRPKFWYRKSVDLDIESGSSAHYNTFVNTLRSIAKGAPKKYVVYLDLILILRILLHRYYVTGAPQCPFPDKELGNALNSAFFDAVYVQFCGSFCLLCLSVTYAQNWKITTFVKLLCHQISIWLFGNNISFLFWLQGLMSNS